MDRLWSPWRSSYIAASGGNAVPDNDFCVFCDLQSNSLSDEQNLIVFRGKENFIVLNLYPYTSGHSMVVPYRHVPDLDRAPLEITTDMMELTRRCQGALRIAYNPDGFNIGMNQGSAGGAGVASHMHMHLVPRWIGDANFVTTIGETRVLPESLQDTYRKIKKAFDSQMISGEC